MGNISRFLPILPEGDRFDILEVLLEAFGEQLTHLYQLLQIFFVDFDTHVP